MLDLDNSIAIYNGSKCIAVYDSKTDELYFNDKNSLNFFLNGNGSDNVDFNRKGKIHELETISLKELKETLIDSIDNKIIFGTSIEKFSGALNNHWESEFDIGYHAGLHGLGYRPSSVAWADGYESGDLTALRLGKKNK